MSDRTPAEAPIACTPEVRAVMAWLDLHALDVDEAPLWKAFRDRPIASERLRLLLSWMDSRPSQRGRGIRVGHPGDPHKRRATVVVAYLRGEFRAPDLAPVAEGWAWRDVCALAAALDDAGEKGWGSYRDVDTARSALSAAMTRRDLDIPRAPPDLEARIGRFLADLEGEFQ